MVTAYTSSAFNFLYDSLDARIFAARPCESPCKECEEDDGDPDTDQCTQCFTETELSGYDFSNYYLDEVKLTCLEACADGYYPNAVNTCKICWEDCKTCSSYQVCTSCDTTKDLAYLFDGSCNSACPDGSYADGFSCIACDENCLTCADSADKCMTCDTAEESPNPYFLANTCVATCGAGYARNGFVCEECDFPCATCATASECVTCEDTFYKYHTSCVAVCPVGSTLEGEECLDCDPNCAYCGEDLVTCLQCQEGFVLYKNTCYTECPEGTELFGGVECLTKAEASADAWGSEPLMYFPFCMIMLCMLAISIGSEILEKKSSFLSNSLALWGLLILPQILTMLCLGFEMEIWPYPTGKVYLGVKPRSKEELEALTGASEQSSEEGRMLQEAFSSASARPFPVVFTGALLALAAFVGLNMYYRRIYKREFMQDAGFSNHTEVFPRTCKALYYTGVGLSFTTAHLYYSYLFGRPEFDVQFTRRKEFHNKVDKLTKILVGAVLFPLFVASIAGLALHDWGKTQYVASCADTIVMVLALAVISYLEYRMPKENRGL